MKSNQDEFWIDEAIESYPLEALPEGFVDGVLSQIEPRQPVPVHKKIGWDLRAWFLYAATPLAIFGFSLTVALLVHFRWVWIDPAQVSYYRSVLEYWWLELAYSGLPLRQLGIAAMAVAVLGGFTVLWQLTDPARKMDFNEF